VLSKIKNALVIAKLRWPLSKIKDTRYAAVAKLRWPLPKIEDTPLPSSLSPGFNISVFALATAATCPVLYLPGVTISAFALAVAKLRWPSSKIKDTRCAGRSQVALAVIQDKRYALRGRCQIALAVAKDKRYAFAQFLIIWI